MVLLALPGSYTAFGPLFGRGQAVATVVVLSVWSKNAWTPTLGPVIPGLGRVAGECPALDGRAEDVGAKVGWTEGQIRVLF